MKREAKAYLKKLLCLLTAACLLAGLAPLVPGLDIGETALADSYNAAEAVAYARKYAKSYNPAYTSYNGSGGDCANFVSQCLLKGGLATDTVWYEYSYAWKITSSSSQKGLYEWLTVTKGYHGSKSSPSLSNIKAGDLIWTQGTAGYMGHVMIVSEVTSGGLKACGHSNDRLDLSMSLSLIQAYVNLNGANSDNHLYYRPLSKGMTGTDVRELQQHLIDLGYNLGSYGADGDFGADTESAVKAFQSDNGLTADGIFGEASWAKLQALTSVPHGSEMASGYDRVLPDGDYFIVAASGPDCFLDIPGSDAAAANGANVQLWTMSDKSGSIGNSSQGAWTITYSNGFYKIKQKTSNMCLDVKDASTARGANVQVATDNGTGAQRWAISRDGGNGYYLQAKCSGYYLDYEAGSLTNGTNVLQYTKASACDQYWAFIPYHPAQPVSEGRYMLVSALQSDVILDVAGDTGSIPDGTNVDVWADSAANRYNSFDLTKLANGYYTLTHAASGKALTVDSGDNVVVSAANGGVAQQWAIRACGSGYALLNLTDGGALDAKDFGTANGTNVSKYRYHGKTNQIWTFVPAEHRLTYDANGGTGAPAGQIKYYKNALTITSARPARAGYDFLGWAASADAQTASIQPGDPYTADADLTLYAVWKKSTVAVSGVSLNQTSASLKPGDALTLTATVAPGDATNKAVAWSSSDTTVATVGSTGVVTARATGTATITVTTMDGGYTETCTVKVVPVLTLPSGLIEIGEEAFAGSAAAIVVIPQGCEEIGARAFADCADLTDIYIPASVLTISRTAFAGCPADLVIHGASGSVAQSFANARGYAFAAE